MHTHTIYRYEHITYYRLHITNIQIYILHIFTHNIHITYILHIISPSTDMNNTSILPTLDRWKAPSPRRDWARLAVSRSAAANGPAIQPLPGFWMVLWWEKHQKFHDS